MEQSNTQKLIETLKTDVADACSKATYDFNHKDILNDNTRVPNEHERRSWLKSYLGNCYFGRIRGMEIPRSTYYTLKGMITHGNLVPVLQYLFKHGYSNVYEQYDAFCHSKCFMTIPVMMTLCNPIPVTTIEVTITPPKSEN